MLTVVAFLASTTLVALCIQLAWTRIVVNRTTEAKERELDEENTRHKKASAELLATIGNLHDDIKAERIVRSAVDVAPVEKTITELLAALGELHDEIKADRIARSADAVAARAAERRASRPAPPPGPSTGDPAEPTEEDRKTLTAAPPPGCAPEAVTSLDDDLTTVISREALPVALRARAKESVPSSPLASVK